MKATPNKFSKQFVVKRGLAQTLPVSSVSDSNYANGTCSKTHKSGWTISGEVQEDYYRWINDFEAHHPDYGYVRGNFEDVVWADSEEGYEHFIKHHPYEEWNYADI